MNTLVQCVRDAVQIKLSPTSPGLRSNLATLRRSSGVGIDTPLRDLLNSTIGGAYQGAEVLQSDIEMVAGASVGEKMTSLQFLVTWLQDLRDTKIEYEAISVLIPRLQTITG